MGRILEGHPIAAERAAAGLNPANCVLLRGCGSRIQVMVKGGGGRADGGGGGRERGAAFPVSCFLCCLQLLWVGQPAGVLPDNISTNYAWYAQPTQLLLLLLLLLLALLALLLLLAGASVQ